MSMIKCPECGKDVSSKAKACPQCGYPIESKFKDSDELSSSVGETLDTECDPINKKYDTSDRTTVEKNFEKETSVPSFSMETGSAKILVDSKKERNRVIAVIVGIVVVGLCIFGIYSCANSPLKSITDIDVSYKSNGSVWRNNDASYTLLAGTTPEQSDVTVLVEYDNETKRKKPSKIKTFIPIDGPTPLENGKTTTYEVSFESDYAYMVTHAPVIEKVQLKFEGADVDSITDAKYTGSGEEGIDPSEYSFTMTVNYSNGTIAKDVTPQSVDGAPLVAGQTNIYSLTYGGKSTTVEVMGMAKKSVPKKTTSKKKKKSTNPNSSSSSKRASSSKSEEETFKASCKSVTYEDLILDESSLIGKKVKFKGQVLKILGTGTVTNSYAVALTHISGDTWENPVYMDVTTNHLLIPLSVGDICTFYGEYDGVVSSSSVGLPGGSIPSLAIDYVDF